MNKLIVIDFQYLYYKYKFALDNPYSRMKRLHHEDIDISYVYYPLNEIAGLTERGNIDSVICFDSKQNDRKDENEDYKASRESKLGYSDFANINTIKNLLEEAGHIVLYGDGKEADDFVAATVMQNKDKYDVVEVYTVDSDLLQLVDSNVAVNLFKQKQGYLRVTENNFEETIVSNKLLKGAYIPYNFIALYKSTVGDTSDGVKGIKGFGGKAFLGLTDKACDLRMRGTDYDVIESFLRMHFDGDKLNQALESLDLVKLRHNNISLEIKPNKANNLEAREKAFSQYDFKSLI